MLIFKRGTPFVNLLHNYQDMKQYQAVAYFWYTLHNFSVIQHSFLLKKLSQQLCYWRIIMIIILLCITQDLLLQASPTRLVGNLPQKAQWEDIPQQALQETFLNMPCRKIFHNKLSGKHSTISSVGIMFSQHLRQTYTFF